FPDRPITGQFYWMCCKPAVRASGRVNECGRTAPLFRGRHFADENIVLCVRWYLRYSLSFRGLRELMAERHLNVDHPPIWRWVQGNTRRRLLVELKLLVLIGCAQPNVRLRLSHAPRNKTTAIEIGEQYGNIREP